LRKFDSVVGVSGEIVDELVRKGIKNVSKISNGIDADTFTNSLDSTYLFNEFGLPRGSKMIGMISSLTSEKGHLFALQAFASIVRKKFDAKLLIIGDGPLAGELKRFSLKLGISDCVLFSGKRNDIPQILSILDVFLIPSLVEGLPMAMLEAMAAGKTIIASRVGEIPEVIEDGKNGLLVDAGSVHEIEQAVERVLLADPYLRKQFGENARKTVITKYSSKSMAEKYSHLYESVLAKA
jgi:glycosyltransferase involved in cell wall biosynthesis